MRAVKSEPTTRTIVKAPSFTNNPAPQMNHRPNLIAAAVFIALGLALGGWGVLQLRQAASRYQATAGVRVTRDPAELAKLPTTMADSVFQQTQAEIVQSESVLVKVIEKLDLNHVWGKEFGPDTVIKTSESGWLLRRCTSVSQPPGSSLLQITATDKNPAQAQLLANSLAVAFCEVRQELRQHALQAALDTIAEPLRENEAKFQRATQRLAQARAALDPAVREMDSPPSPAESASLRELQQESARLTMLVMVQSNQLARVQSLPAEELQKLVTQYERTTNRVAELETALRAEAQKQAALKNFWDARQELEQVNIVLEPLQNAVAEQRALLAATNNPAAIVAEPATTATKLPARSPVAFGCLGGAIVLLLLGAKLLGSGSKA